MTYMTQDVPEHRNRLLDEAIKPNAQKIARICLERDVALIFFAPGPDPDVRAAAKKMGWKGGRIEVRRMTRRSARDFADLLHPGDPAAAWFRRRVEGRIFVVMEGGTLCVNFIPGCGFTLEPGTTNSGWMV